MAQSKRTLRKSQQLRKNMTKEERHLWYDCLKPLPVMVHRQKVVGPYIVDFYIAEAKLAIELDGSQHYGEKEAVADRKRDAELNNIGITVVRYSNSDISFRFDAVCQDIWNRIYKPSP